VGSSVQTEGNLGPETLTGTLATRKQNKWLHVPGGLYRTGNVHILRGVTFWNGKLWYFYREWKYIF
jgi:hypothetical protein